MDAVALTERECVVLEIVEALGGRTSFDLIETLIRAQYRKHLRLTLTHLAESGCLLRYPPGMYALTGSGRDKLHRAASSYDDPSALAAPFGNDLA